MLGNTLVFGGSSGLGAAFSNHLIRQGVKVLSVGRRSPRMKTTLDSCADYRSIDITDVHNQDIYKDLLTGFAPQHIAFFLRFRGDKLEPGSEPPFPELALSTVCVKRFLDVFFDYCREAPTYRSLLFCSSPAGLSITSSQDLDYHLAKSAIDQMVRYYAVKCGGYDVRVNAISPSYFYKKPHDELPDAIKNKFKKIAKATPLGYIPDMEEICQVGEFLLSKKASYLTGQNIYLDGGLGLRLQDDLL